TVRGDDFDILPDEQVAGQIPLQVLPNERHLARTALQSAMLKLLTLHLEVDLHLRGNRLKGGTQGLLTPVHQSTIPTISRGRESFCNVSNSVFNDFTHRRCLPNKT